MTKKLRSAIPNIKIVKIEFLNQAKNIIVWQRTLRGIHKEDFMGIPSTNQKVKWVEMVVSHFKDNKIVEEWAASEILGELLSKSPC